MICDDCKHRDKCTKIISESATDCVDKSGNRLVVALPNGKFLVCYSSNVFPYKKYTIHLRSGADNGKTCCEEGEAK